MSKFYYLILVLFLGLNSAWEKVNITDEEQKAMTNQAEDWMDDMPEGLQDRMSDAVAHAIQGFYSEIDFFRHSSDTTGLWKYPVLVKDIKGGKSGDISMRVYSKDSVTVMPALVFFHGGGWSMGSLASADKFCRALASEGGVRVISVEYPLAPENPYPAALNKCEEAVEYIFAEASALQLNPEAISLGGEGAGGNLAVSILPKLPESVSVKSLVLYYPLLQTTGALDSESKRKYGRGYGFDSRLWESFIEAYGNGKAKPIDSTPSIGLPEAEELDNLPPTLLITAGRDIVIKESQNFAARYDHVEYVEFTGALHGFLSDGHQQEAFAKAIALSSQFLSNKNS